MMPIAKVTNCLKIKSENEDNLIKLFSDENIVFYYENSMALNIVSANIRFANPADGLNDWEFRRPHLLAVINELGPAILGTQEGREAQIRHLAEGLEGLSLIDGHREWISERMYPCLFIDQKIFHIHNSGDIWLSDTPAIPASKSFESFFPRLCVWAEVEIKSSGMKLVIINTHLDHVRQETRIMQARVLASEVAKLSPHPKILMGDFNEAPSTLLKTELMSALDLKDPWDEKKLAEETSHHSFKGEGAPGDRIDWILVPTRFEVEEIRLEKRSFNGTYPSDHFPLFATVIPN